MNTATSSTAVLSWLLTYALRLEERGDFAGAREQVERVAARAEAAGLEIEPTVAIRRGLLAHLVHGPEGGAGVEEVSRPGGPDGRGRVGSVGDEAGWSRHRQGSPGRTPRRDRR